MEKYDEKNKNILPNSEGNVLGSKMVKVENPMHYPYNSICKLSIENHFGTAFFLRDKYSAGCRFLMTCAHMFISGNSRYLTQLGEYVLQYPAY